MLHKIIYKNFKSNIRKYILFFVSNIIAVAELFIFWGLNDVVVRAVTEPSIMMGIKSDFMIAVGLITVVTILLMVFSMRYYIKLRAKVLNIKMIPNNICINIRNPCFFM